MWERIREGVEEAVVVCLAFVPRRKRPYVPPGRLGVVCCCVSHTAQILTMPLPPLPLLLCGVI